MDKLFWIDMEMTGLDVQKEVVIEAAAIITDLFFNELASYETVIKQAPKYLENMDEWNKKTHTETGLIKKISGGRSPTDVETDLISLVDRHFGKERPVLAGNSIAQDRLFIDKYFKQFASRLHYRMLDVSSWKILMKEKYGLTFEKRNSHRAVDDIRESINELKYYLQFVNVTSK